MPKKFHFQRPIKIDNSISERKIHKTRFIFIIFLMFIVVMILLFNKTNQIKQEDDISLDGEGLIEDEENQTPPIDNGITIVVDPGHGGRDPGKIGVNKSEEKDINLSISLKVRDKLSHMGYRVIMTREDDVGLYAESDDNKKASDLRNRVDIVNNSDAFIAVSIHQNSFTGENVKGAQVFYFGSSQESEIFANIMQEQIKMTINDGNKRLAKADNTYYMLKNTSCPIVIVECGFLSNYEEASLLIEESYQEQMAEAISLGLDTYIKLRNE